MKMLSLVRHAKSSWSQPELSDRQRPLNKRGKRDAPKMAAYYTQHYQPDCLLSSPAVRARLIADEFSRCTGLEVIEDEDIYLASTAGLCEVLARVPDEVEHAALFGHNPDFTMFCNHLTGEHIDNIPTSGIAVIQLDIDSWQDFIRDSQLPEGELLDFYYPKMFDS
jgi:phosphohistidine phosphatase